MFAVSDVGLLNHVLLTVIFGSATPLRCQLAREPASKPEPTMSTSSVIAPWCPDAGFAAVTDGPAVAFANEGGGAVTPSICGASHASLDKAAMANNGAHARKRNDAAIRPPHVTRR